jgi:hypothetical protein
LLRTGALKEDTERLTVEYEIFACDRLPVSEDGITYSNITLPSDQFNNSPSFIVEHNKSATLFIDTAATVPGIFSPISISSIRLL